MSNEGCLRSVGQRKRLRLIVGVLAFSSAACGGQSYEVVDCWPECSAELPPLIAEAVTPHSIYWTWDPSVFPAGVSSYMLRYVESSGAREASASLTWDADDDPNLAWAWSPFGPQTVARTTLTNLKPLTLYDADLFASFDDAQMRPVARGRASTAAETADELVIFSETEATRPGVYLQDFQDPSSTDLAYSGNQALWFVSNGSWIHAKMMGLGLDVTALPADRLAKGYLELFISIELDQGRPLPVYYSEIRLFGATRRFALDYPRYATLPIREGWHRIEVPLILIDSAEQSFDAVSAGGVITQFSVGANWGNGRHVRVDDVRIRY